jgi:hypothetical protein
MNKKVSMLEPCACSTCRSVISDPICTSCQIDEVELRLRDLAISSATKSRIIEKLRKKTDVDTRNGEMCILCHEEEVSICQYCLAMNLSCIISKAKLPSYVSEDFFVDGTIERGIAMETRGSA